MQTGVKTATAIRFTVSQALNLLEGMMASHLGEFNEDVIFKGREFSELVGILLTLEIMSNALIMDLQASVDTGSGARLDDLISTLKDQVKIPPNSVDVDD